MNDLDDDLAVDLTPLIDVTFMLVIFFLMTMSFTLPVIDFTLPQAQTAQVESQRTTLRISVDAHGSFMLNNVPCAQSELGPQIQEHVISSNNAGKELTLELVIDAAAPSQHLITVADLARTYTQGRLMVVTTKKEELNEPLTTSVLTQDQNTTLTAPAPHSPAQDPSMQPPATANGSTSTEPEPSSTPVPAPAPMPATEVK